MTNEFFAKGINVSIPLTNLSKPSTSVSLVNGKMEITFGTSLLDTHFLKAGVSITLGVNPVRNLGQGFKIHPNLLLFSSRK